MKYDTFLIKNTHSKPLWCILLVLVILSINTVSAGDWGIDNYVKVTKDERTVEVWDTGLFLIGTDTKLATAHLDTEFIQTVGVGYEKVFQMTINSHEDYENLLSKFEFYNVNDKMKKVEVKIDLKYQTYDVVNIPIRECDTSKDNLTLPTCILIDNYINVPNGWSDYISKDMLKNDEIVVSGWTNTKEGDLIEWIPTIAKEKIDVWAIYNSTGGTKTVDGNYTVVTFKNNGVFNITSGTGGNVSVLVVAGGGGAGGTYGAGGGGGLIHNTSYYVTGGGAGVTVIVGAGGAAVVGNLIGNDGEDSIFGTLTAIGGGHGGTYIPSVEWPGGNGGSGGSSSAALGANTNLHGNGTAGQGYNSGDVGEGGSAGGGGGAGGVGQLGTNSHGGAGGIGYTTSINGSSFCYAGGGGGGEQTGGSAGGSATCGGGAGVNTGAGTTGVAGTANTGGGAGGSSNLAYNGTSGGSGIVIVRYLTEIEQTPPIINLNSPIDYFNASSTVDDFSFNITYTSTDWTNLTFVVWNSTDDEVKNRFWANGTADADCSVANEDGTYAEIECIGQDITSDDVYQWNVYGCNDADECKWATSNFTFTLDTTPPTINITYPLSNISDGYVLADNKTIYLNWTTSDTNLDTCWYYNNTANVTVTCGDNSTFYLPYGTYTHWVYANDSFYHNASDSETITYSYTLLKNNETYTASTTEGIASSFTINLETNGTPITIAYLNYNGTNYIGSISSSGNNYILSKTQIVPEVSAVTNVSFYWNITMPGTDGYTTTSQNQTINPIAITENCTGRYVIYNFTSVDEITQDKLAVTPNNVSIKVDLDLYDTGRTSKFIDYFHDFSQTNATSICIDNNLTGGETYSIDLQIQYSATNYSTELYHIQDYVLNSSNLYQNLTLYDLDNDNTQEFKLIARDTSFLPIEGALIEVERKYIENGTFKIVEIPKTDARGITTSFLQLNDVIYNFRIILNGTVISTFINVNAICQTPLVTTCEIDFNAIQDQITIPDYTEGNEFSFTLGYNDTSKVITSNFIIPSGEPALIELVVIKEDALGTSVCSDSLTSASGLLSCTIPASFGNSTVLASLYKGGVLQGKGNIKTDQIPSDIFGVVLIILSVMVMLTLIGIGISDNPVVTAVFLFVGVVLLFSLNLVQNTGFFGVGATILFLAIAIILIIIKAAKRS